jgi:Prp8 binding protein
MSGEKRPAPEAFGTSHQLVVKRNKADAELNAGTALVKGSSQNGALVQSVCAIVTLEAWGIWKKQSANPSLQVPRTSGLDAPIMELTGEILLSI